MYKLIIEDLSLESVRIELGTFSTAHYALQAAQIAIQLMEYCKNPITDTPSVILVFPNRSEVYLT